MLESQGPTSVVRSMCRPAKDKCTQEDFSLPTDLVLHLNRKAEDPIRRQPTSPATQSNGFGRAAP